MSEFSRRIWLKLKPPEFEAYLVQHIPACGWELKSSSKTESKAELIDTWAKELTFIQVAYHLLITCTDRNFGCEVLFAVSERAQDFTSTECEQKCNALVDSISRKIVLPRPLLMVESARTRGPEADKA